MSDNNPLLAPWTTPFGLPPFDRIRSEHFVPAFEAAMAAERAEVAAIGADPAPPSFANTIEALQRSGRDLVRVGEVFSNLVVSLGGPALEAVDTEMAPRLAQHGMQMALDPAVFARVDALHRRRDELGLPEDARRLLDRTHLGLVRSGAALDAAAKARMAAISERLAVLHTQFGQNVVHDEATWFLPLTGDDLDGLPDFLRAGMAQAAAQRGLSDFVVTLSRSLIEPFLTFSARRDLRQVAYAAWIARGTHPGEHDNRPMIPEILSLRAERARLLGYANFAEFRLADSMAGTVTAVQDLLAQVWEPAKRRAAAERDRLLEIARAEGFEGPIEPWDWRYYAEKVRRADHALDEAELKPYFSFGHIQQAAFDTAGRLFGLRFTPVPDAPAYHPDVRTYEVTDAGGHVGVFLADPYARADKRSGAWMSSFRDQETLNGPISPIIVNNNNFAKSEPTLLSFDDAETLFHEFGHALHGLLSRVRYPAQSGTSVRRDFVELPSQIYEHWLSVPETLRRYAVHNTTGEPVPDALIGRLLGARNFNQGFATVEYASSALIDLALHVHPAPETIDIEAFEAKFLAGIGMPREIGLRHRPAHFQHLFAGGGYAAGYYSYLWSEVLDADGFEVFEEAGDPFDPAAAARLRTLFSAGDTRDPMELYIGFRGRPPSIAALLRGRGLAVA
ncbi:M3 family metallopeptidase [Muricoccus radiodurans]|uniref:M3 family metallopeptidase n=1 Tax=Muricoccus radiodurans TaxID=2231721 RepID=UPI003CFA8089